MLVQDNFELAGQTHAPVASGKYRITIMSQEQFGNLMSDLIGQAAIKLVQVRNNQRDARWRAGDLKNQNGQTKPQILECRPVSSAKHHRPPVHRRLAGQAGWRKSWMISSMLHAKRIAQPPRT